MLLFKDFPRVQVTQSYSAKNDTMVYENVIR